MQGIWAEKWGCTPTMTLWLLPHSRRVLAHWRLLGFSLYCTVFRLQYKVLWCGVQNVFRLNWGQNSSHFQFFIWGGICRAVGQMKCNQKTQKELYCNFKKRLEGEIQILLAFITSHTWLKSADTGLPLMESWKNVLLIKSSCLIFLFFIRTVYLYASAANADFRAGLPN